MKALFILPHYHAETSANNICINRIIDAIVDGGGAVDVLCTDGKGFYTEIEFTHGIRIITMQNIYNSVLSKTGLLFNTDAFAKLPMLIQFLTRVYCYLKSIRKPFTDYYAVDAISRKK